MRHLKIIKLLLAAQPSIGGDHGGDRPLSLWTRHWGRLLGYGSDGLTRRERRAHARRRVRGSGIGDG